MPFKREAFFPYCSGIGGLGGKAARRGLREAYATGSKGVTSMLRFIARVLGNLLLAVAVVYAVGDIARTIADDVVATTSLTQALAVLGVSAEDAAGGALAPLLAVIGPLPAALVFFAAALVFLLLGRSHRRRDEMRVVR